MKRNLGQKYLSSLSQVNERWRMRPYVLLKSGVIGVCLLFFLSILLSPSASFPEGSLTKANEKIFKAVKKKFPKAEYNNDAKMIVIKKEKIKPKKGKILIITAGTSDIPIAEEAVVTTELMGNKVEK